MNELISLAHYLRARFERQAEDFKDNQMLEDSAYALIHLNTFIDAAQALSLQEYRIEQSKKGTAVPVVTVVK